MNAGDMLHRWTNGRYKIDAPPGAAAGRAPPLRDPLFLRSQSGCRDPLRADLHRPRRPAALAAGRLRRPPGLVVRRQLQRRRAAGSGREVSVVRTQPRFFTGNLPPTSSRLECPHSPSKAPAGRLGGGGSLAAAAAQALERCLVSHARDPIAAARHGLTIGMADILNDLSVPERARSGDGYDSARRVCLRCHQPFRSGWRGHRICGACAPPMARELYAPLP